MMMMLLNRLLRSLTSAAGKDRVPQNSNKSNWKAKVKRPKKKDRKQKKKKKKKRYNSSSSKGKQ
jgi:hypothetical protein